MKIYLLDNRAVMEICWNAYFSDEKDVTVVCDDLHEFQLHNNVECIVSPAKSFHTKFQSCVHYYFIFDKIK